MIEGLIFDMDGLLFDSERIVQRAWNMTGEELGIGKIGDHIYNTLGMNVKSRTAYFQQVYGPEFPMDEFHISTRKNFSKIADTEGVPLKLGAVELLEYAKRQGSKLGLATSSRREHATRLLKRGNIYDYFDGVVFGDMVKNAKPDPEIYLLACETIGINPKHAVALEDSPLGIRAAHAAGMYAVMVPDMVMPSEDIRGIAYKVLGSLCEVAAELEDIK